jgi:hypothetical protein
VDLEVPRSKRGGGTTRLGNFNHLRAQRLISPTLSPTKGVQQRESHQPVAARAETPVGDRGLIRWQRRARLGRPRWGPRNRSLMNDRFYAPLARPRSVSTSVAACKASTAIATMRTGNLPLFPGIFPDRMAPIVRTGTDGERELVVARWGMPGARIGEDGSAGGIAASSRQRHFASRLTPSRARCPFGSP